MKKIWIFMLKIAIAVLIVAYLIHVHYNSFINGLQKFNPVWLPAAVSILLFEMVFCAWRWFSLLKTAGLEIKWFEALSLTMRGYFCSLILFGGAIGGDVAKIGMLAHSRARGERFEPGLSILIDRIIGMVALFLLAIIIALADFKTLLKIDLSTFGISEKYNIFVIVLFILICIAGIAAAIIIFECRHIRKINFMNKIFDWGDRITHGLINRMERAMELYKNKWKKLLFLTISSIFFVHLIQLPVICCICYGLNMQIPSYLTLTAAIITGNIAGLIPLTPGGIGLRDFTIFIILQSGGFSNTTLIPLLMSLVLIIANMIAGLFFFDGGCRKKTAEKCGLKEV